MHALYEQKSTDIPHNGRLEYGVVSTPFFGDRFNGDAYVIQEHEQKSFIAVIDGLGHGKTAYTAARIAVEYLEENWHLPLMEQMTGCHLALKHSRGAVLGLVQIDLTEKTVTSLGVGNIRIQLWGKQSLQFLSSPGIVGLNLGKPRLIGSFYRSGDTLIINSDGISSGFEPKSFLSPKKPLQQSANEIIKMYGNNHDDATVVLARIRP